MSNTEPVVLLFSHVLFCLQEEDIRNFRAKLQQIHRPSCVAVEKDLRKMNLNARVNDSSLGKVSANDGVS